MKGNLLKYTPLLCRKDLSERIINWSQKGTAYLGVFFCLWVSRGVLINSFTSPVRTDTFFMIFLLSASSNTNWSLHIRSIDRWIEIDRQDQIRYSTRTEDGNRDERWEEGGDNLQFEVLFSFYPGINQLVFDSISFSDLFLQYQTHFRSRGKGRER